MRRAPQISVNMVKIFIIDSKARRSKKSMWLSKTTVIAKICWVFINIWNITKFEYNFHSGSTRVTKPRVPNGKGIGITSGCISNTINYNSFIRRKRLKIRFTRDSINKKTLYNTGEKLKIICRKLVLWHRRKELKELIETFTPF